MTFSQKNALFATFYVLAISTATTNAFAPPFNARTFVTKPLFDSGADQQTASKIESKTEEIASNEPKPLLINDIPPAPRPVGKKKAGGNPHKEGVFSPIVIAAGAVMGKDKLKEVRAKVISMHSDVIKSFVDTSDSAFGKAVLARLFNIVDKDKSRYLDRDEVAVALRLLGFKWLQDKHVDKIFERADADENGEISLNEFLEEAPKTLRTNLIKLAKTNGGDMGLLV